MTCERLSFLLSRKRDIVGCKTFENLAYFFAAAFSKSLPRIDGIQVNFDKMLLRISCTKR